MIATSIAQRRAEFRNQVQMFAADTGKAVDHPPTNVVQVTERPLAAMPEAALYSTSRPWRSARPMVACEPALNSRKSASMPSLKITPRSGMWDSILSG